MRYDTCGTCCAGVEAADYPAMLGEHWYALCERQNLQYGPKFQMVVKYAVDRTWTDIKYAAWPIYLLTTAVTLLPGR